MVLKREKKAKLLSTVELRGGEAGAAFPNRDWNDMLCGIQANCCWMSIVWFNYEKFIINDVLFRFMALSQSQNYACPAAPYNPRRSESKLALAR